MALIECPECEGVVSERAPVCIHCGCPLAGYDPPGQAGHVTIEATKKGIKLAMLVAGMVLMLGVAAGLTGYPWGWPTAGLGFCSMIVLSLVRWWEHG